MSLCTPAKLYIIIFLIMNILHSLFVVVLDVKHSEKFKVYLGQFVHLIINVIILCIWTYFLNWLCKIGHSTISWILFWIPIVLSTLGLLLLTYLYLDTDTDKNKNYNN